MTLMASKRVMSYLFIERSLRDVSRGEAPLLDDSIASASVSSEPHSFTKSLLFALMIMGSKVLCVGATPLLGGGGPLQLP